MYLTNVEIRDINTEERKTVIGYTEYNERIMEGNIMPYSYDINVKFIHCAKHHHHHTMKA
jgi:hypothetical protein